MTNQMMKKENRITISGLLLIGFVFLAPLESFFSSSVGSLLKFYTIGCIAFFVLDIFIKKRRRKWHSEIGLLLGFLFIIGISVAWSDYFSRGIDALLSIGLQVVFIIAVASKTYSEKEKSLFLISLVLSSLLLSILLLGTSPETLAAKRQTVQTNGTDIDPNNIGALISCGLAVLLPLKADSFKLTVLKFICEIIMVVACLYTASRGAFLAMIAVLLYNIVSQRRLKKKTRSLLAGAIIVVGVYFVIESVLSVNPFDLLMERFTQDSTGSDRTVLWKISLDAVSLHPFFGYGLGGSPYIIGRNYIINLGSHNTYVTIWLEAGIFALALFMMFIITLWRKKDDKMFDACVFGTLTVSMVCSFFIDTYNKKILWLPIMLCVIAVSENQKIYKAKKRLKK